MSETEYAAVTASAWMNENGHGTDHYLGIRYPTVAQARRDGFQSADGTDDFLLATLNGDNLTALASGADGFGLDWTDADYADVAQELGLIWRGDRIVQAKP